MTKPQSQAIAASRAALEHLVRGEVDRAEAILRPALAAAPDDPFLLHAAGNCALVRRDDDRALELYGRSIAVAPTFVPSLLNLGYLHRRHYRLDEARRILRQATRLEPHNAVAWLNLTSTYVNEGDPATGEAVAREALLHCPASPDIRWNLSLVLLEQGRWREGWTEYRHRFQTAGFKSPRYGPAATRPPRLECVDDLLPGQTVVCHGEQGLGDQILFAGMLAEFAADVTRRGGRLLIDCNPRLRGLFADTFCPADGGVAVLPAAAGQEMSAARAAFRGRIDWAVPIGDLAGFYRNSAADFLDRRGYLSVCPDRVASTRERLARHAAGRRLVGLAWTGGLGHTHAAYRRIPLDDWLPLLRQDAVFVSLEYHDRESDIRDFRDRHGIQLLSLPDMTGHEDYRETFHLVAALDLVVTVPTSVLHVAGALGRPCWIVMHERAAWRECSPDASMPWYPGTHERFVRRLGDPGWTGVIERVATALGRFTARPGGTASGTGRGSCWSPR